jgi:hypothetical protein
MCYNIAKKKKNVQKLKIKVLFKLNQTVPRINIKDNERTVEIKHFLEKNKETITNKTILCVCVSS